MRVLVVIWCLVYTRVFFRRIAGYTTVLNATLYNLCICFKNHHPQNSKAYRYHSSCLVLLRRLKKSGSPYLHVTKRISLPQNHAFVFHGFELRTELSNFSNIGKERPNYLHVGFLILLSIIFNTNRRQNRLSFQR